MDNKQIAKLLKKQIQSLGLIDFGYTEDEKFAKWYTKTKLYIVQGFVEHGKDHRKNIYLEMFEDKVNLIPKDVDRLPFATMTVRQAKNQIQDVLRNFIEILEEFSISSSNRGNYTKIEVKNSLQSIQKVSVKQTLENILDEIKKVEKNPEKVEEAKQQLESLKEEIKKGKKENWERVKPILKRLADFGKDVVLTALPLIFKN